MKRSTNLSNRINKDIEAKKGLMTNIEDVPDLTINFQPNYHQTLLETQHLSLKVQAKLLFEDLNMIIKNRAATMAARYIFYFTIEQVFVLNVRRTI